jgi:hypothetical protein
MPRGQGRRPTVCARPRARPRSCCYWGATKRSSKCSSSQGVAVGAQGHAAECGRVKLCARAAIPRWHSTASHATDWPKAQTATEAARNRSIRYTTCEIQQQRRRLRRGTSDPPNVRVSICGRVVPRIVFYVVNMPCSDLPFDDVGRNCQTVGLGSLCMVGQGCTRDARLGGLGWAVLGWRWDGVEPGWDARGAAVLIPYQYGGSPWYS